MKKDKTLSQSCALISTVYEHVSTSLSPTWDHGLCRGGGSVQALLLPPLFLFDMAVPAFRRGGAHLGGNVVNRHLIKKKKSTFYLTIVEKL